AGAAGGVRGLRDAGVRRHPDAGDDLRAPGPVRRRGAAAARPAGGPRARRRGRLMLEVRALSKAFGGVAAISDLDFRVEEGSVYAVIGPNGAGKTTLFNMLCGIYRPDRGDIRLRGESVL